MTDTKHYEVDDDGKLVIPEDEQEADFEEMNFDAE